MHATEGGIILDMPSCRRSPEVQHWLPLLPPKHLQETLSDDKVLFSLRCCWIFTAPVVCTSLCALHDTQQAVQSLIAEVDKVRMSNAALAALTGPS